jgi:AcrR family transcriptional regulator
MRAAVTLVAERGTTNITVSEIAETADVSRQLLYQQFGDRDTLLLKAALDLAECELMPIVDQPSEAGGTPRLLTVIRHFAQHRPFYRAMLTGSSAYELNRALSQLLTPSSRQLVVQISGTGTAPDLVEDLTVFAVGGWAAVINTWIIETDDPLDPEAFAERLTAVVLALVSATGEPIGNVDTELRPKD